MTKSQPNVTALLYLLNYLVTFTVQYFVTPSNLTRMRAVPGLTAYTVPLSSTVATLDLFDFHCGGRPEDVDACKVFSVSGDSVIFVWLSLISGFFTVTRQVVFVPSAVIVIYVLPGFSPQTFPESVTEATLGFLDLNWGCERLDVVARSWQNSPCSSDKEEELNWIFVLLTVTIQRASAPGTFAVIFAWPPFLAVTRPYVFTDATLELLLFQVGVFPLDTIAPI